MSETPIPEYGFQVIIDGFDNVHMYTCFKTVLGKKTKTARPLTTRNYDRSEELTDRLDSINDGLEKRAGCIESFPVKGNKVELQTTNGQVYFLVPEPEHHIVSYTQKGTVAYVQPKNIAGIEGYLTPLLESDKDRMMQKMRAELEENPNNPVWKALKDVTSRYGELSIVSAIKNYQLLPEQIYLTKFGLEHKEKIDSCRMVKVGQ